MPHTSGRGGPYPVPEEATMPRGGSRPGAGAPKGNLNALKTGAHSRRLRAVLHALASIPELRDFFLEVRRRQLREQRLAARIARQALLEVVASSPSLDES